MPATVTVTQVEALSALPLPLLHTRQWHGLGWEWPANRSDPWGLDSGESGPDGMSIDKHPYQYNSKKKKFNLSPRLRVCV